jgi:hypothetical protein
MDFFGIISSLFPTTADQVSDTIGEVVLVEEEKSGSGGGSQCVVA